MSKLTLKDLAIGTKIYNHGDICNPSHFGTVTAHKITDMSIQLCITEDGSDNAYWVSVNSFDRVFKGHGGTRLVTAAAYHAYRAEMMKAYSR